MNRGFPFPWLLHALKKHPQFSGKETKADISLENWKAFSVGTKQLPEEVKWRGRCWSLHPCNWWQDSSGWQSCANRGSDWILGKISLQRGWWNRNKISSEMADASCLPSPLLPCPFPSSSPPLFFWSTLSRCPVHSEEFTALTLWSWLSRWKSQRCGGGFLA